MDERNDSAASPETRRVIHDLRQPLAALQMWVELLGESLQGQLGEQQERYLGKVRAELARLGSLLERSSKGGGATAATATATVATPPAEAASASPPLDGAAARAEEGARLAGLALLVVEDDEMTAEALQLALESEGASVSTAGSIADGLARFEDTPPDVVLSDLRLSDGDGLTLVEEIRKRDRANGRRTAAIAVTGFDSSETQSAARAAGFDETITKPFHIGNLIETVARLAAAR